MIKIISRDWRCDKNCQSCEGTARVFIGLRSVFSAIEMQMIDIDVYDICENAEYIGNEGDL